MKKPKKKHLKKGLLVAGSTKGISLKNDIASMEHPMYTLSEKPDNRSIEYIQGDTSIEVLPGYYGLPNMNDKDLLIYCCSLFMKKKNKSEDDPYTVQFSAYDFFKATGRQPNGRSYTALIRTLDRLTNCMVKTNIPTNKKKRRTGFTILYCYEILETKTGSGRMANIEVTLSDWIYNAIAGNDFLTMNNRYFKIKKPLEKRLYEIARKHCGHQPEFKISLQKLYEKSGSSAELKKFKQNFRAIIEIDPLPDYRYYLDKENMVTIENKKPMLGLEKDEIEEAMLSLLRPSTISHAKEVYNQSLTDWRFNEISNQFLEYNASKKSKPKDLDKAFIGFVKKKVQTYKKDSV